MKKLTGIQVNELLSIMLFANFTKEDKAEYMEKCLNIGKTEVDRANDVAVGVIATDLKHFIKKYGGADIL